MQYVVILGNLISHIENPIIRSFAKYKSVFHRKIFTECLLELVKIVEESIKEEMKSTKGYLIYDGWTWNGIHYLGVFLNYCTRATRIVRAVLVNYDIVQSTLTSVSPIDNIDDSKECESVGRAEANTFNAESHIKQLENVFSIFNLNPSDWTLCQVGDNVSVNKRIATLLNIPHVGCLNHKLNLDVKEMLRCDQRMSNTLESVQRTMSQCRKRLKNRATLRNLTDLSPTIPNETR